MARFILVSLVSGSAFSFSVCSLDCKEIESALMGLTTFLGEEVLKVFLDGRPSIEHAPGEIDVIAVLRPEGRHRFGVALLESFDEGLRRLGDGRLLRIGGRGAGR